MSSATPSPQDAGLPAPPTTGPTTMATTTSINPSTSSAPTTTTTAMPSSSNKPTILHLGDDIRWNHDLYRQLGEKFNIERSYSMGREEFKNALREKRWGDFVGMYRPFWNTGGEMGDWDGELIALLPKSCKIYASAGAGFDWVDTRTLASHGIIYCNSASACTESVADTAIFLLLSTYRAFPWSYLAARSCDPSAFVDANQNIAAQTHNPNGSVLGIIGLGKIGFRLAQKAIAAFGMRVRYHDVVRFEGREKELKGIRGVGIGVDGEEGGEPEVKWCPTLEELLSTSDCVVLATPFEGRVLLGRAEFAQFKQGSRLVNIARGKLVDEEALVEALEAGVVRAAGLDVHAAEPQVNPWLAGRRDVMVLSHTAGASVESHVGFERLGMENLFSFFGEPGTALTPVNLQWLVKKED